jgi:peptide/nickel transport system substrate-binding protein
MRQTLPDRARLCGLCALSIWLAVPANAQAPTTRSASTPPATTLVIGQYMFPPGRANPYRSVSPPAPFFWGALFDGLTTVDDRGRVQPALALSWRRTDDNTWRFKLRPEVSFSNGETFTAETVVRNIDMLHQPEAKGWIVATDVGRIRARAVDEHMVEIRSDKPDPMLPRFLSTLMMVAPDHWKRVGPEEFATHPVGTGPFRLVGDWSGTRLEFEAFASSWRAPRASRLVLLDMRDMTERVSKVASGEIDIATNVDADARPGLEAAGGGLHVRQGTAVAVFAFVVRKDTPLARIEVRQALNYAVDKQALIDRSLAGATRPSGSGLRANVPGYDRTIKPFPYDPRKARELLAAAGYDTGLTLKADYSAGGSPAHLALLREIVGDLQAVGVELQLQERPVRELMGFMFGGGWKSDMFLMDYNASTALDPMQPLQLHSCGWMAPWYCNDQATPLIAAAAIEHDEAKRDRLLSRIYRAYHDDASALYLYDTVGFDATGPSVVDFRTPNGIIDYSSVGKRRAR